MTTTATPEELVAQAYEIARSGATSEASAALFSAAGGDRHAVEAARNLVASRIHAAVDDWGATAALSLLNRTLSQSPRHDPLDWRVQWTRRFRRP